jgi:hydrogenase expression/formation protein HypE
MKLSATHIGLEHGSGGRAMNELIHDVFLSAFEGGRPGVAEDQARIALEPLRRQGDRLALTTDSYVVSPLFFPGGDIGKLAVHGTVNDLAVGGAVPLYLTCAVILEEGLPVEVLQRVVQSMKQAADEAGVRIVTGDTKVVERGSVDKLFINTTGLGLIAPGIALSAAQARAGDKLLTSGSIGDHGAAIVRARGQFALDGDIASDTRPLHGLVQAMLGACPRIRCMRDATRGGVAAVLNELAEASQVSMLLREAAVPVRREVRGLCELLGLDPLYLANEGKLIAVVPEEDAELVLRTMRAHPDGSESAIVGEVRATPIGRVVMSTAFGGERIVDMPHGEQLPRIC